MLTYKPFRIWCMANYPKKNRSDIARETGLSRPTVDKIWNDEPVMTYVIEQICKTYDLRVEQVCQYEPIPGKETGDE